MEAAGALQLLFRLLVARPDGDVKRRVEHLCRQRHVDVFSVAADGRDETGCGVDTRFPERFILRGIGRQRHNAVRFTPLHSFWVIIDEDHARSTLLQSG